MYLYVTIVWYDGYESGSGEVLGHYRTMEDAIRKGQQAVLESDESHYNVYKCVF